MGIQTTGSTRGYTIKLGQKRSKAYSPMSEINVTPFVDVMLVLLIVFMVTAPLLTSGVSVDLPRSDAKPINEESNQPIMISVDRNGRLFIGEREIERQRLIPLLRGMTSGNRDRRIFIRGDSNLSYGAIMDIIGSVNGAGFAKVALISEPRSN